MKSNNSRTNLIEKKNRKNTLLRSVMLLRCVCIDSFFLIYHFFMIHFSHRDQNGEYGAYNCSRDGSFETEGYQYNSATTYPLRSLPSSTANHNYGYSYGSNQEACTTSQLQYESSSPENTEGNRKRKSSTAEQGIGYAKKGIQTVDFYSQTSNSGFPNAWLGWWRLYWSEIQYSSVFVVSL